MISIITGALLPVVVTLALGVLAGWHHDDDEKAAGSMNRMVMVYALPLALFAGTVIIPRKELISDWPLLVTMLSATLLPFLAAYLTARHLFGRDVQVAALQAMAFGFPAIAFTGIPILTPLIGSKATVVIDVAGLTTNIIIIPATLVLLTYAKDTLPEKTADRPLVSVGSSILSALREALVQPVVLSPLLAIAFVLASIHLPSALTGSLKLLGSTAAGVSLFASGVILQARTAQFSLPAAISTAGRLVLVPGLAYLILTIIHVDSELRKMTVLGLGLSASSMQVILSSRYKANEKENAAVLLYSSILCIPTLTFFIWLTR